jgi:hypothetical protein
MGMVGLGGQVRGASYDGAHWNEAELALFEVAALLASGVIGLLRVADTLYEAWPLPTSRVRGAGRDSHPDRVMRDSAGRRHSR